MTKIDRPPQLKNPATSEEENVAPKSMRSLDDQDHFRSISLAAVGSIVFSVFGLLGWVLPMFVGLFLCGIVCGVIGWLKTTRFPDEITGKPLAIIGTIVSLIGFVCITGWHVYVYQTEVPEDSRRLIWAELQPPRRDKQAVVSARSLELNGSKVFMKGYVMQPKGGRKSNLKSFILVRDLGTCCFGDADPKPTHIVKIDLPENRTTDWNMRLRKLTGIFHVDPSLQPEKDVPGVYYSIDCDWMK